MIFLSYFFQCGDISAKNKIVTFFCIFNDTFKVKCPVRGAESVFSLIWNRWTWIWWGFITLRQLMDIAFENNVPPALNLSHILERKSHLLKQPKMQYPINFIVTHGTRTIALHMISAMLYQVSYWASLLCQKSHIYGAGYAIQMW